MKILIVGAGPTGLTAALELARQNIFPEIVDAKERPSELPRALGILPESLDKLSLSGADKRMREEGIRIEKLEIYSDDKEILSVNLLGGRGVGNMPLSLPQDRTESIMSDTLREMGVGVQYNHKVVDITSTDHVATVTFSNGDQKTYDWVIGADGVHSTVRKKMGIAFVGYDLPETWSIADIELQKENSTKTFREWLISDPERNIAAMIPMGPTRVRLVSSTPDSIKAVPMELAIKKIRRAGTFTISIRQAETYIRGRVLLAGDAAHTQSPVGGRGMNLGIDDAVAAAKSIVEGRTSAYDRERQLVGSKVIRDTERIRKLFVSKNFFIKSFLRIAFFVIQHVPALGRKLVGARLNW